MKIVDVSVQLVRVAAPSPAFKWRRGLAGSPGEQRGAVLVLRTDDGVTGRAFDPHGVIVNDVVDRVLRHELLGQDPMRREYLWQRAWEADRIEELPIYALGLADVALWDLAGRALEQPAHVLMGNYRSEIPAYASTTTFSDIAEFLDVADQCLELGFAAIKLHAWGDAKADAELATALREHVGPDVALMYDGSAAFDLGDAVYLGRALSSSGYSWYEEPMREFSIHAYQRLADRVDVPLLVAETSDGAHFNTADFLISGCATHVRTSARYKAGITGALRVAHLAEAFMVTAEVHGAGPESQHLCMAIPNNTYYESFVSSNPVTREDVVTAKGLVHAPTDPGVGLPPVIQEQLSSELAN